MNVLSAGNDLIELVRRGGVYYNLSGATPREVLEDMIATVPVPKDIPRENLLKAILEREALMPTAVGEGIAIPHPRNPIITDPSKQFVSVCFLQEPIDWKALDGKNVGTLILIVSASPKLHLGTLTKVSFLCQQEAFRKLLAERASREELIAAITDAERAWS